MGSPTGTPSQTAGPYFSIGLCRPGLELAADRSDPAGVWLRGRVLDGAREVVTDALVESWQVGSGQLSHGGTAGGPGGFGRSDTAGGEYAIWTVKPPALAARDDDPTASARSQAPHVDLSVLGRGLMDRLVTRLYFADEAAANAADPVLSALPAGRRATLLAEPTADGYRLDIVLQGADETVFFTF